MADTQQGVRHQSARDAAGTTDTYDGDLRALFNAVATVPAGSTFNEAFMLWLQSVTGSSADNINDLAALYASQQDDTYNWSSVGSLGPPEGAFGTLLYLFDCSVASTVTEEGTGASQWTDLINGYAAAQGTDANRPTFTTDGSNPALLFNGSSDFLEVTGLGVTNTKQQTIFGVARTIITSGLQTIFETNSGGTGLRSQSNYQPFSTQLAVTSTSFSSAGSSSSPSVNTIPDTGLRAFISRHEDSDTGVIELDNAATGEDTNVGTLIDNFDKVNIGRTVTGSNFFNGYIMQCGAYQDRLSDANKTALMDLLKSKWGL